MRIGDKTALPPDGARPSAGNRPLRLLLLTYYCPPAGGPGVQRVEMLLRHLPPEIHATVITAAVEDYQACSPLSVPLDPGRFGAQDRVHRLSARRPYRLFRALSAIRLYGAVRWLYCPDIARRWARAATDLAAALHRDQPFDVVLSTAPPFSVSLAGRECARRLGIPWVSDFRDLWTDYLLGAWPSRVHHLREQRLEEAILREATATVTVTPGSRQRLLSRYSFLPEDRVLCVTNGYDAVVAAPAPLHKNKFVVVHLGVFCNAPADQGTFRQFVRGHSFRVRRVDRSTHSPAPLVRAMELLGDPRVEFRHLGPMDSDNQTLFDASAVRDQIKVCGYRDHGDALAELRQADAAYLCLATLVEEGRNELIPQKTFEYLGARKPVLAPIQDGDAKDCLLEAATGLCCSSYDPSALTALLRGLVQAKFEGRPTVFPREDVIRRFEWSHQAARLLEIVERAASAVRLNRPCALSCR